ncbi:MAG: hypothetical protein MZV64_48185 [Ignavibacteriales bacterium]|nr:hypothetical protein [Ignavibacteriales bacterium]
MRQIHTSRIIERLSFRTKKNVHLIREPGGTEISEKIREILLDKKTMQWLWKQKYFCFQQAGHN